VKGDGTLGRTVPSANDGKSASVSDRKQRQVVERRTIGQAEFCVEIPYPFSCAVVRPGA